MGSECILVLSPAIIAPPFLRSLLERSQALDEHTSCSFLIHVLYIQPTSSQTTLRIQTLHTAYEFQIRSAVV
jgi:hypothetical protein